MKRIILAVAALLVSFSALAFDGKSMWVAPGTNPFVNTGTANDTEL